MAQGAAREKAVQGGCDGRARQDAGPPRQPGRGTGRCCYATGLEAVQTGEIGGGRASLLAGLATHAACLAERAKS